MATGREVRQRATALLGWAEENISGRSRTVDLRVLSYVCDQAFRHKSDLVICAVRDIQLGAGVGLKTAARSLQRLVRAGALIPQGHAADGGAMYRLSRREHDGADGIEASHLNLWRHRELGPTCQRIWWQLSTTPQTVAQIAREAGPHRSTVKRNLPALAVRGLAAETDGGWVRGPVDPIDVEVLDPDRLDRERRMVEMQRDNFRRNVRPRVTPGVVARRHSSGGQDVLRGDTVVGRTVSPRNNTQPVPTPVGSNVSSTPEPKRQGAEQAKRQGPLLTKSDDEHRNDSHTVTDAPVSTSTPMSAADRHMLTATDDDINRRPLSDIERLRRERPRRSEVEFERWDAGVMA